MLTLKNFENEIFDSMLKKGRDYFTSGAVISLDETKKDHWQAEVEGTESYEAEVQLKNGNQIIDYFCDCPYEGELCKHIVAVFFAIREEKSKLGGEKLRQSKREVFEDLLQKITLEEYKEFIRYYASSHKEFKDEFELWFAGNDNRIDVAQQYKALIKKSISKYNNGGFIDYRSTHGLYSEVGRFLDAGEELLKKKRFYDVFALAKAVLNEMMDVLPSSDDSDGYIGAVISDNIRLLEDIIDDNATDTELKEQLYEFLKTSLNNEVFFDYGDFGYELFELFRKLSVNLEEPSAFLRFIDLQLPKLAGKYDDYRRDFFIRQKIDFLKEIGRATEAEKLVQQNLDIVEVRQGEVNKAITQKDYPTAKKLIADGIKIAEKKDHPGTVSQWLKELLRIAVLEKNVEAVRYYAIHFAFDRGFDREYYQQWKKTYPAAEWKEVIEEFIEQKMKQMKNEEKKHKGQPWYAAHFSLLYALAPLYVEEKYWDRLLALVKQVNNFDTTWQYHNYLVKPYPLELLELYLPALEQKADQANQRRDYADLALKMQRISKDIPQGKEKILVLARRFKEKYARRPAMIDELNKILK
jgi:hypothetical protein